MFVKKSIFYCTENRGEYMSYKTLSYEEAEPGIGVITMNRPKCLNALNFEMLDELDGLFGKLRRSETTRVLVLTGAGRGFCAGADIRDERMFTEGGLKLFSSPSLHLDGVQRKYSSMILTMRRLPQPFIAAVNGPAAGGGMSMALASDIIFANSKATFTPSFVNIGLSGGELGTSYYLPRLVGVAKASEILMTGRTVDAAEADKIGLVSRLVDDTELMEVSLNTARILLSKSRLGLKFTKESITLNLNAPNLESAIELEDRNQSICCCAPEFFDAVAAFGKSDDK